MGCVSEWIDKYWSSLMIYIYFVYGTVFILYISVRVHTLCELHSIISSIQFLCVAEICGLCVYMCVISTESTRI